jgi:hypothetical protein
MRFQRATCEAGVKSIPYQAVQACPVSLNIIDDQAYLSFSLK